MFYINDYSTISQVFHSNLTHTYMCVCALFLYGSILYTAMVPEFLSSGCTFKVDQWLILVTFLLSFLVKQKEAFLSHPVPVLVTRCAKRGTINICPAHIVPNMKQCVLSRPPISHVPNATKKNKYFLSSNSMFVASYPINYVNIHHYFI